jgi:hypothetical protein
MASKTEPKRADSRFQASLPATLHYDGKDYPCSAFDLSRNGVLLSGELPQPDTPDVEVSIKTATGDLRLRITAQLVHIQRDEQEQKTKLGLQFTELDSRQREIVESMVNRVMEGMAPAALAALPKKASAGEIRQALNNIPLAHRVMVARRGQLEERRTIRHDAHPEVLEALARNPNILLPEILALARVRHISPATVAFMAEDPRWGGNEELKILLASHPRVTFTTAERIVNTLSEAGLKRVIRRPGLQPGVRKKLTAKLARKLGGY